MQFLNLSCQNSRRYHRSYFSFLFKICIKGSKTRIFDVCFIEHLVDSHCVLGRVWVEMDTEF